MYILSCACTGIMGKGAIARYVHYVTLVGRAGNLYSVKIFSQLSLLSIYLSFFANVRARTWLSGYQGILDRENREASAELVALIRSRVAAN